MSNRYSQSSYEVILNDEIEREQYMMEREDRILDKKLKALSSLSDSILTLALMVQLSAPVVNIYCNNANDINKIEVQTKADTLLK